MKSSILFAFFLLSITAFPQNVNQGVHYGDATMALGNRQVSISIDYFRLWRITKSKKAEIGLGARVTSYFGRDQYYSSAPASLASDKNKSDSISLQSPQINAFNAALNLGYRLSNRVAFGFNIDLIGISIGGNKSGFYMNNDESQPTSAKPTTFNILLIGNNDRGSLNSEFYLRYFLQEKFAFKLAYQYLFTEYTTDTKVQQIPQPNDRFRNKSGLISLGVTKQF